MFRITMKNILKNKVLNLCLAVGFILSIAVICAVPMYSDSVLNNYIQDIFKTAENKLNTSASNDKYTYSAVLKVSKNFNYDIDYKTLYNGYEQMKQGLFTEDKKLKVPIAAEKVILAFDNISYSYNKDNNKYYSSKNQLLYISDFSKHINFVKGEMGKDNLSEANEVEVITDKSTFDNFNLELNKSYEITSIYNTAPLKLKIVGVFEIKDKKEGFWLDKDTNFYSKFIVTERTFMNILKNNEGYGNLFRNITLETIYDVKGINTNNASFAYNYGRNLRDAFIYRSGSQAVSTISDNLKNYVDKEKLYSTVMWIFLIPVIIVVLYYIWMVSGFIVEADKEQIAVLKSRGASKLEIMRLYLYQGLALSFVGLVVGPLLSYLLCKAISYSDGFLAFSREQAINITFTYKIYIFAVAAVIILLSTLLISVYFATERSIVEVRRNKNRYIKLIFNNKYMDLILLAIAGYGYYNYAVNKNVPLLVASNTEKAPLDPLLYLTSTVFIIGAGMFCLRLYRYIVKLSFKLGKNRYFHPLYIAIINVMRYHLKNSVALLFVVITVSIGIFNVHVAKDINTSYMNTVKYTTGTDFILKGKWDKIPNNNGDNTNSSTYSYIEPSYTNFTKIDGIDRSTKVLNAIDGEVGLGNNGIVALTATTIMGIIPNEFGQIAYFDSNLLSTHWYNYLNSMTKRKDLVLISKGLSNSAGIKVGDTVFYKIKQGLNVKGTVYAVVDYWPGYSNLQSKSLLISNFNYMFSRVPIAPYEIWMKKKPIVSDEVIYSSIKEDKLQLTEFKNLDLENYNAKSDIFLKGTNSILNLGFLSIGAVTILGFIIYWIISLRSRSLSFGVYRSLGVSTKEITITLIIEQLLTLGASILLGMTVGNIVERLFTPLIKELWYKNRYVIPARNLSYVKEYIQFSSIVFIVFVVSFIILNRYLADLKINQAIKLGDD